MDEAWVPQSLRHTLRDILECGNGAPFRSYYAWVAQTAAQIAREHELTTIVELGCGTAPITRHLLQEKSLPPNVQLIPCDLNPDQGVLTQLKSEHPARVAPILEPVDFSVPRAWSPRTLLLLSATFHHIPPAERLQVLESLTAAAPHVAIFEPLRRTVSSMLFVFGSLVPALLTPLRYLGRPGTLRRVVWCWVLPLGPLCFVWDGIVSCLREWEEHDWQRAEQSLAGAASVHFTHSLFSSLTRWRRKNEHRPESSGEDSGRVSQSNSSAEH
jgi:phospholipid N-methyltransferase